MQKIIRHSTEKRINTDEYEHFNTKTTLNEDTNGSIVYTRQSNNTFGINTNQYVTLDCDVISYLFREFSRVNVSRILQMATMVSGAHSVLTQENYQPHNSNSLRIALGVGSNSKFYEMVREFEKENILHYGSIGTKKIYQFNPFVARRGKVYNDDLLVIFKDVLRKNES